MSPPSSESRGLMEFFATCPTGFEQALADELRELGLGRIRPLQGRVSFEGQPDDAYMACLWSRLASRVVLVLDRGDASDSDQLYELVYTLPWEDHLATGRTFAIDASGTNAALRTSQFVAQRAKDALVDHMRDKTGTRPTVSTSRPDLSVVVRIAHNRATIGIDLTGEPLFKRGYERGHRGLRADYAALLLYTGDWHHCTPESLLLHVHPEQATLLIEAASITTHRAPGILRPRWGFMGWAQHDASAWDELLEEANASATEVTPRLATYGGGQSDLKRALRAAGFDGDLRALAVDDLKRLEAPALLVCDLASPQEDLAAQASLVAALRQAASTSPSKTITFARDSVASLALQSDPTRTITSKLGKERALICAFDTLNTQDTTPIDLGDKGTVAPIIATSDQFARRLKKVARLRKKWARREDVTCYRVYDADLPDYALTIDLFQGTHPRTLAPTEEHWLLVSEYAPPKEVDPALARCRLLDGIAIATKLLDVPAQNVFVRIRRHDKGGSQYADEATQAQAKRPQRKAPGRSRSFLPPGAHLIEEGGLVFEVNFSTRLDCGIFLDHRETRSMLREMAKQTKGSKRFLNLFAYTGTATCYAADGGMLHTTTVDLSRPSLDWARRNMERNGFVGREHEYVQADVIRWIGEQRHTRNRWDLIFCDVPTFSNSRRMRGRSFDVQRDHVELLIGLSRLLTRNGTCVFSCNLRTFKPDVQKLLKAKVHIENITDQTICEDFSRNKRVHHAFIVHRT